MPPTIAEILRMPSVRRGRPEVISGESRLDTEVRWVHVSEVRRLSPLLQGGELILSTGLTLTGGAKEDRAYLRDLVSARAAGLVIELGPTTAAPSGGALDLARELEFPLVVLHREVPFVSITEEVHRSIVSDQMAELEFARRVHEAFTELSVTRAAASRIVEVLGHFCRSEVVLEDLSRNVVAFFAGETDASSLISDWEDRSRLAPVLEDSGTTGPEGWLTCPVGPRTGPWARLVLPLTGDNIQHCRLLVAMERAASALEIARLAEHERAGLLAQAQGGLVQDLEAGDGDEPALVARAVGLGLLRSDSYLPMVVRSRRHADSGGEPLTAQRRAARLLERTARAVDHSGISAVLGVLATNEVGVVIGLGVDRRRRRLTETRALERLAAAIGDRDDLVIAVGPASRQLAAAGRALGPTRHIAEVASTLPTVDGGGVFFRNSDVRLPGLVALMANDPRVQAFVEAELGPLLEHEAVHKDGLIALLRRYLELGGNMSRLSVDTNRSRSSLYERIAKIESILRLDISDPASQLSLGFALLAYEHSRKRSQGSH